MKVKISGLRVRAYRQALNTFRKVPVHLSMSEDRAMLLDQTILVLSRVLEYTPEKGIDFLGISCFKKNPKAKQVLKCSIPTLVLSRVKSPAPCSSYVSRI